MIYFKDISRYQGDYDMGANPDPAIMIKMSGGDDGLYYDSQAANNYNKTVANGKVPMMYHFYGGQDPVTEADFFIGACSPLADGDIMAIDVESGGTWNPQTDPGAVAKVTAFVNRIHDRTGMWPWVYLNRSTRQMYDWSPALNNCALWIAAPDVSFDADIPGIGVYQAQQGPIVNGVDTNAFFGTLEQLKKFGYNYATPAPQPAPQPDPTPAPTPEPTPQPVPTPTPTPIPEPTPVPTPEPVPSPQPTPQPTPGTNWKALIGTIVTAGAILVGAILAWLHS